MAQSDNLNILKSEKREGSAREGFAGWLNAIHSNIKMHSSICLFLLLSNFILFLSYAYLSRNYNTYLVTKYIISKFYVEIKLPNAQLKFSNPDKTLIRTRAHTIYHAKWVREKVYGELYGLLKQYIILFIVVFSCYPLIILIFKKRAYKKASRSYIRGAKILDPKEFKSHLKKNKISSDLPCGEIKIPVKDENRHFMVIGKQGSGKSNALRGIIKRLIERGEKGLIYDKKGEYLSDFYNPKKDLIFNPLDKRTLGWNLFNELDAYMDVDAIAASLIPPTISSGDSPFWNDAARGVFGGALHYLYQNDKKNNAELWSFLTSEAEYISEKLKNTKGGEAGYKYITKNADNSNQAESVLSVLMQYTKCFEYMSLNDGDFSISQWLSNGEGMIYVTAYEDIEETLKPILSLFIDLMGRKLLSLSDSTTRRLYFMIDEFGSLQRLTTMVRLLTLSRSKGGCVFLATQDDGQSEQTYGRPTLRSIDNSCANRITFALSGETAEREAKYNIGEVEYRERLKTEDINVHGKNKVTISERKQRGLLFLPSDIENLPDLTGIVKFRGYNHVMSQWQYSEPDPKHSPFDLRDDLLLDNFAVKEDQKDTEDTKQKDDDNDELPSFLKKKFKDEPPF